MHTTRLEVRGAALCQVSPVDELSFSSGFFLEFRCSGTLVHCIRSHGFRTSRSFLLWTVYEMGATLRRHFLRAVAADMVSDCAAGCAVGPYFDKKEVSKRCRDFPGSRRTRCAELTTRRQRVRDQLDLHRD